jgi:hypothetical protein
MDNVVELTIQHALSIDPDHVNIIIIVLDQVYSAQTYRKSIDASFQFYENAH